uniref:Fatty acid 2-hydroxylase n=1 Tax=Rhodosorus marinus TaxID=101924 RepID=A0A7S3EMB6_9RHOD|mmetsp:Transcript_6081/g.25633  ORF Transcript_6081/g.25633 Transcript_6081/m.25633 type:complete len:326 (+) Transcript_6081:55-1032(+)
MADTGEEYVLTKKTVAFHNDDRSAWVIVDGEVYDVTLFMEQHPGGAEVLKEHLGKDVSDLMRGMVDGTEGGHGHSAYAYKLLSKYHVGSIAGVDKYGNEILDGNIDPVTGEQIMDWGKPILPQVGRLGDKYCTWIHSFPTADHTVKMFQNDTLENLTKCPWYIPLLFWIPIIVGCLGFYFKTQTVDPLLFLELAFGGHIFWLLFEYSLHRFIFHMKTTGFVMNIIHFLIHGHHHITPMDANRAVFPPVPALIVGGPIWALMHKTLGVRIAYPILLGFVIGYLVYDMTHYYIHFGDCDNSFLKVTLPHVSGPRSVCGWPWTGTDKN